MPEPLQEVPASGLRGRAGQEATRVGERIRFIRARLRPERPSGRNAQERETPRPGAAGLRLPAQMLSLDGNWQPGMPILGLSAVSSCAGSGGSGMGSRMAAWRA